MRTETTQEASVISHDSSNEEKMAKRRGINLLIAGLAGDQTQAMTLVQKTMSYIPKKMNMNLKDEGCEFDEPSHIHLEVDAKRHLEQSR